MANDLSKLCIQIGSLPDGRWIAATSESPYFCFEADSEKAVVAIASRALKFYERVLEENGGKLPDGRPQFKIKRTVSAKDLVAA